MDKLRQQVIDQQRRIKDLMDLPNDSAAKSLNREVQALEDDIQVGKSANNLENRVERIIHILKGDARRNRVMDYGHLEMFEQWFMNLRNQLRKM